jgi:hypothetical protein
MSPSNRQRGEADGQQTGRQAGRQVEDSRYSKGAGFPAALNFSYSTWHAALGQPALGCLTHLANVIKTSYGCVDASLSGRGGPLPEAPRASLAFDSIASVYSSILTDRRAAAPTADCMLAYWHACMLGGPPCYASVSQQAPSHSGLKTRTQHNFRNLCACSWRRSTHPSQGHVSAPAHESLSRLLIRASIASQRRFGDR